MIKAMIVINTQGKPRLAKFYEHQAFCTVDKQRELIRKVFSVLSSRVENVSNFMETDSIFEPLFQPKSLDLLESISSCSVNLSFKGKMFEDVFVETLDKWLKNVYELDIVFNYDKMHTVSDEMILSGQLLETNSAEIRRAVEEISKWGIDGVLIAHKFVDTNPYYRGSFLRKATRAKASRS